MSRFDRFRTHRRSRRLRGHDYASGGWTFVTICTAGRAPFFGEIRDDRMHLSPTGTVAHACWAAIPDHTVGVGLGAFVVMPNHVHGLIHIRDLRDDRHDGDDRRDVAPLHATALPPHPPTSSVPDAAMSALSPRARSVSVIVRSYKSAVTRAVRPDVPAFAWQPRFHDHVVRNEGARARVAAYIDANPSRWATDRLR